MFNVPYTKSALKKSSEQYQNLFVIHTNHANWKFLYLHSNLYCMMCFHWSIICMYIACYVISGVGQRSEFQSQMMTKPNRQNVFCIIGNLNRIRTLVSIAFLGYK